MLTPKELALIGEDLLVIPFYPIAHHDVILRMLERFVDRPERLRWLVDAAVMNLPQWGGVPALRGLYCTRFKPADGIEADCAIPGFTPDDNETAYLDAQSKLTSYNRAAAAGIAKLAATKKL